jgi:hypothetical protein
MPNTPSTASIARLRGEFSCAATEAGFLQQQADVIVRDLRRALILCPLVYILFGVTDLLALGWPTAVYPMLARATMGVLAFVGLRYVRSAAPPGEGGLPDLDRLHDPGDGQLHGRGLLPAR